MYFSFFIFILATGLKSPGTPRSFFLPEGYQSFEQSPGNRIFTFLLGGTSSERWSAACLNVYMPVTVNEQTRYIPEGIILLSPFNNLSQLKMILKNFLLDDYQAFSVADPDKQHEYLLGLLKKSDSSVMIDSRGLYIVSKTFLSSCYSEG